MFRIGEFSKIAHVAGGLLRYYDKIGLFTPQYSDPSTGYRYYSASQLPRLNRILALKEFGLTLDQIAHLIDDDISHEEIRGMLTMKKAQIEQSIREEVARVQQIEARIAQIEREGQISEQEILLKSVPTQQILAMRNIEPDVPTCFAIMYHIMRTLPRRLSAKQLGQFVVLVHSEMHMTADIDIEMGCFLTSEEPFERSIVVRDDVQLTARSVQGALAMASTVTTWQNPGAHIHGYQQIGAWVEANGYQITGIGREIILQAPQPNREHEAVIEIQFPVEKVAMRNLNHDDHRNRKQDD